MLSPVGSENKNRAVECLNNTREDLLEECEFAHDKFNCKTPIVEINLYGLFFPALIDTGSMICAISDEVWGQLGISIILFQRFLVPV